MTIAMQTAEFMITHPSGFEIELQELQGLWTVEQYLKLTDSTRKLIEFTDGSIEVLPMPTRKHQRLLAFLYTYFLRFMQQYSGEVLFAPLRIEVRPGKFREPDLLLLLQRDDPRNQNSFWLGADLVVEIVSPDDPDRDLVEKVTDYAEASIPEYWIVNPLDETVRVLTLSDGVYIEHGRFQRGSSATSRLLEGFGIEVDAVFNAV